MYFFFYVSTEGKRHDSGMLAESGLMGQLELNAHSINNQPMCLYGDRAYPLRVHLQTPYQIAPLTQQMRQFNSLMSSTRVSVEWLFGNIINYYRFVDFKKNLKIGLSSVGKMYLICALLQNAHLFVWKSNINFFST